MEQSYLLISEKQILERTVPEAESPYSVYKLFPNLWLTPELLVHTVGVK